MGILVRGGTDHTPEKRNGRRWRLPPLPTLRWIPFEGARILDEVPGDLGAILWQRYRDVLLWGQAGDPSGREGLFCEPEGPSHPRLIAESANAGELTWSLQAFAYMVVEPEAFSGDTLLTACLRVSDWCVTAGYFESALDWAELAAQLFESDPDVAFHAGRTARKAAAYHRAEEWFDRAIALARFLNDRAAYIDALLGWANMEFQRGNIDLSRGLLHRAYRQARKAKIRRLGAAAHHNLVLLEIQANNFPQAQFHAAAAFRLYAKRGEERLLYLAHDTAHLWAWMGYHSVALKVFEASLRFISKPHERVQVYGNIAWSAAAVADIELFLNASDQVTILTNRPHEYLAEALVNVARGARALGLTRRGMEALDQALSLARKRQEGGTESYAMQVSEAFTNSVPPDPVLTPPGEIREMAESFIQIIIAATTTAPG